MARHQEKELVFPKGGLTLSDPGILVGSGGVSKGSDPFRKQSASADFGCHEANSHIYRYGSKGWLKLFI
jgi:hypothetical protein